MSVDKSRLQLGLDALRSGEFEQCSGSLRSTDITEGKVRYCCLGVLTEVAIRNGLVIRDVCRVCQTPDCEHVEAPVEDRDISDDVWAMAGETLSKPVMSWYGLESSDPEIGQDESGDPLPATAANDDKNWNFAHIADGFEAEYITDPADARPAV
jgi:hypothetical protein